MINDKHWFMGFYGQRQHVFPTKYKELTSSRLSNHENTFTPSRSHTNKNCVSPCTFREFWEKSIAYSNLKQSKVLV